MKTVISIIGIRPDIIRMKYVIEKLDQYEDINHILIHTGQHYDHELKDQFFEELNLRKPDYTLVSLNETHYDFLSNLVKDLPQLIKNRKMNPDLILFLGDSHSVMVSAVLKKEGYKIAHIEAGMRSYDSRMPEEINRKVCDHSSDLLFVYHDDYKYNLLKEGFKEDQIKIVGNTIVEPVVEQLGKLKKPLINEKYILVDIHRNEMMNERKYVKLLFFITKLSRRLNANVYLIPFNRAKKYYEVYQKASNIIKMLPPIYTSYNSYINLQENALMVISDSGTAQEECPLLKVPCIVPRNTTERYRSVGMGASLMIGEEFGKEKEDNKKIHEIIYYLMTYGWSNKMTSWLYSEEDGVLTSDLILNGIKEFLGV